MIWLRNMFPIKAEATDTEAPTTDIPTLQPRIARLAITFQDNSVSTYSTEHVEGTSLSTPWEGFFDWVSDENTVDDDMYTINGTEFIDMFYKRDIKRIHLSVSK